MVRQAVEGNLDVIHDRLPKALRPARRWQYLSLKWAGRVILPLPVILGIVNANPWRTGSPVAQASGNSTTRASAANRAQEGGALRPEVEDASFPALPFTPGVLALAVRRVVIDAGHGGTSAGTSSAMGVEEKALTLDIAHRMRAVILARGFDAVLTRLADETVSLQERAAIANGTRGDVFVSIHLNSLQPAHARGIETYYLGPSDRPELDAIAERENQHSGYSLSDLRSLLDRIFTDARRNESRRLAQSVQESLVRTVRQINPALTDRGVKMAPFVVLVATEMPAILAEVSCLSNPEEAKRLNSPDYRQTIAEALASGVMNFARTVDPIQKGHLSGS